MGVNFCLFLGGMELEINLRSLLDIQQYPAKKASGYSQARVQGVVLARNTNLGFFHTKMARKDSEKMR